MEAKNSIVCLNKKKCNRFVETNIEIFLKIKWVRGIGWLEKLIEFRKIVRLCLIRWIRWISLIDVFNKKKKREKE